MASFSAPQVHVNASGWGPESDNVPEQFAGLPFAPFGKGDLGKGFRVADFTVTGAYMRYPKTGRRGDEAVVNEELQYKHDSTEDSTFSLVDTAKVKRFGAPSRPKWQGRGGGKGKGKGGTWAQAGRAGGFKDMGGVGKGGRGNVQAQRKRNDPRGNAFRRQGKGKGKGKGWQNRVERQASVKVGVEWKVLEELDLAQFAKLQTNKPTETDLKWCGHLEEYDQAYDGVSSKTAKALRRTEDKSFFYVGTIDDPVIEELATEGDDTEGGKVYATDAILSHLMACPRSVYGWDIVVQKMGDQVFFDKRDDSQFDYLTVSETAQDAPADSDDPEAINSPENLSLEASSINQNFSQQILKGSAPHDQAEGQREEFENPNPFFDAEESAGMQPAAVGYRYRKFGLGPNLSVFARCELHGNVTKQGRKQRMTAFALNEWDSAKSGGVEWRQKIDQQRGAVLATELKNNSFKLAKFAAQSVVAGADQMKIGFVSRKARTDRHNHVILATQFYKPVELATNITMSVTNMWGIIKMLSDKFLAMEDGKYVLMKDPNKPVVRIYSVPDSTFEDDDEEEEEDEEGGEGGAEER